MNWFEITPSSMSAIASIAAAVAAIASWRISKRANTLAEHTALATHHNVASLVYLEEVKKLNAVCSDLENITSDIMSNLSLELQQFDYSNSNTVPLRHVLHNGAELLSMYASRHTKYKGLGIHEILAPLRYGVGRVDEDKYEHLHQNKIFIHIKTMFGIPFEFKSITLSPIFRRVYYQLLKRVKPQDWKMVWSELWQKDQHLVQYMSEYKKLQPILIKSRERLRDEDEKLRYTAFPININTKLSGEYYQLLEALDFLIEDCDVNSMNIYKDWEFDEEQCLLVLCFMGIIHFSGKQLDIIKSTYRYSSPS